MRFNKEQLKRLDEIIQGFSERSIARQGNSIGEGNGIYLSSMDECEFVPAAACSGNVTIGFLNHIHESILSLFKETGGGYAFVNARKLKKVVDNFDGKIVPCISDYAIEVEEKDSNGNRRKVRKDTNFQPVTSTYIGQWSSAPDNTVVKYPNGTFPRLSFSYKEFHADFGSSLPVLPPEMLSIDGGGESVINMILDTFETLLSKARSIAVFDTVSTGGRTRTIGEVHQRIPYITSSNGRATKVHLLDKVDGSYDLPRFQKQTVTRTFTSYDGETSERVYGPYDSISPLVQYMGTEKRANYGVVNLFEPDETDTIVEEDDGYTYTVKSEKGVANSFQVMNGITGMGIIAQTYDLFRIKETETADTYVSYIENESGGIDRRVSESGSLYLEVDNVVRDLVDSVSIESIRDVAITNMPDGRLHTGGVSMAYSRLPGRLTVLKCPAHEYRMFHDKEYNTHGRPIMLGFGRYEPVIFESDDYDDSYWTHHDTYGWKAEGDEEDDDGHPPAKSWYECKFTPDVSPKVIALEPGVNIIEFVNKVPIPAKGETYLYALEKYDRDSEHEYTFSGDKAPWTAGDSYHEHTLDTSWRLVRNNTRQVSCGFEICGGIWEFDFEHKFKEKDEE